MSASLVLGLLLVHLPSAAASRDPCSGPGLRRAVPGEEDGEPDAALSLSRSRPVRPWEFLDAVGARAGIFGREAGPFEAWVYPLKVLRDMTLRFKIAERMVPAAPLARTITVRPESATILYASDSFLVRQTLFVPVDEPGVIILVEVQSSEPLEVRVGFRGDFQLMWPAAIGATHMRWDDALRAYLFADERNRFSALFGSPGGGDPIQENPANGRAGEEGSFSLGPLTTGTGAQVLVVAASFESRSEAIATYRRLASEYRSLQRRATAHYSEFLERSVRLRLPDRELQEGYDWSRISLLQGMVTNPFLGTGLVAGYGISGDDARPGFGWYFGRDALWTSLALTAIGDYPDTRTALEFLIGHQRSDGKMPHEISQSARFVPWFEDYPYAYASADATPLFLVAVNDYAVRSGDLAFVKEHWAEIWKAHRFLKSTRDERGFALNRDVGHGWVEGGPLLPVRTEIYQSGLAIAALRALAELAHLVGKERTRGKLEEEFAHQKTLLNELFWIPEKRIYAFGLDLRNRRVEEASVLATVPMWFDLLDPEKADAMISRLADADHASDWGMRILSSRSERFHPAGYHFGSVWPLFTGWAAVGEYRYHRALPAYENLRANAGLALEGAPGRTTEVLSGSFYEPLSGSSPHQIWSSAMVLSPLLRGLFGLESDVFARELSFLPHVPADWDLFEIENLRVGAASLDISYRRSPGAITLELSRSGDDLWLNFSPAVGLRAEILDVAVNDRPVSFRLDDSAVDRHVAVRILLDRDHTVLRIRLRRDFGLQVPVTLPSLGETSRNLKVVSESWNESRTSLMLEVAGLPDRRYQIDLRGAAQISSVEGAELVTSGAGRDRLRVRIPAGPVQDYVRHPITIHFEKAGTPAPAAGRETAPGKQTGGGPPVLSDPPLAGR